MFPCVYYCFCNKVGSEFEDFMTARDKVTRYKYAKLFICVCKKVVFIVYIKNVECEISHLWAEYHDYISGFRFPHLWYAIKKLLHYVYYRFTNRF